MTESLVLAACLLSGIAGGVGGALIAAVVLRGEDQRWDNRVSDLRSQVEDLEARWLSWQRRANKRTRDATGGPQSDDQPAAGPRSGTDLLRIARSRGIIR